MKNSKTKKWTFKYFRIVFYTNRVATCQKHKYVYMITPTYTVDVSPQKIVLVIFKDSTPGLVFIGYKREWISLQHIHIFRIQLVINYSRWISLGYSGRKWKFFYDFLRLISFLGFRVQKDTISLFIGHDQTKGNSSSQIKK